MVTGWLLQDEREPNSLQRMLKLSRTFINRTFINTKLYPSIVVVGIFLVCGRFGLALGFLDQGSTFLNRNMNP